MLMGLLSAMINSSKTSGMEEAFGAKDITSQAMRAAIYSWFKAYFDEAEDKESDHCQRIPVIVVNKLYKTVFAEYAISVSGNQKAFFDPILGKLDAVKKRAMQYMLIGGECFLKPVPANNSFDFVVVRRDAFKPFARDAGGKITSVGSAEFTVHDGSYYTLLERRTIKPDGALEIESKLYRSASPGTLGSETSLSALEQYAKLQPVLVIPGMYNLGMAQLVSPTSNTVDGSLDGVSVYAPAMGLINSIDTNEKQINDEFENGRSRIIASVDLLKKDAFGGFGLKDKVFTAVDGDPEETGLTIFSPALREASYLARKQEYLRNVESQIGLKRGILSEVEAAERTATEITSSAGDYNLTIIDFQSAWESMVRELLETCFRLGAAYGLTQNRRFDAQKEIVINWGNGILYDEDKVWTEYKSMVSSGMLKPELAIAWYFNEPCKSPADIDRIRKKYMPEIESLASGE